ncbi:hypothetical protein DM01DRAFT_1127890 [Hesseltinella vesiculosa]|uniref:Uncharacterized protein n=1 Tax=Hesseltinella vesiculosa TaxID=101127 RepID=A0A1X2GUK4_9FUNG|nr:hypothetical protein DM01DRAFT_1127890 [Hesseltinella vesiculosa]
MILSPFKIASVLVTNPSLCLAHLRSYVTAKYSSVFLALTTSRHTASHSTTIAAIWSGHWCHVYGEVSWIWLSITWLTERFKKE